MEGLVVDRRERSGKREGWEGIECMEKKKFWSVRGSVW